MSLQEQADGRFREKRLRRARQPASSADSAPARKNGEGCTRQELRGSSLILFRGRAAQPHNAFRGFARSMTLSRGLGFF
eukprot:5675767-Alexandrium_andersonii.AAC.1